MLETRLERDPEEIDMGQGPTLKTRSEALGETPHVVVSAPRDPDAANVGEADLKTRNEDESATKDLEVKEDTRTPEGELQKARQAVRSALIQLGIRNREGAEHSLEVLQEAVTYLGSREKPVDALPELRKQMTSLLKRFSRSQNPATFEAGSKPE